MENEEIWKDIPGFEGLYMASIQGRVKRLGRTFSRPGKFYCESAKISEKVLKHRKDNCGYVCVNLTDREKNVRNCTVHRIVAAAFLGLSKLSVNHIDGDKANNNLNNLEYVTHIDNIKHAVNNNLGYTRESGKGRSKIKMDQIPEIKKLYASGLSQMKISKIFKVNQTIISDILIRYKDPA